MSIFPSNIMFFISFFLLHKKCVEINFFTRCFIFPIIFVLVNAVCHPFKPVLSILVLKTLDMICLFSVDRQTYDGRPTKRSACTQADESWFEMPLWLIALGVAVTQCNEGGCSPIGVSCSPFSLASDRLNTEQYRKSRPPFFKNEECFVEWRNAS